MSQVDQKTFSNHMYRLNRRQKVEIEEITVRNSNIYYHSVGGELVAINVGYQEFWIGA